MSEPACSSCPTPLEPAELISDGTCCRARSRFQYVLLVLPDRRRLPDYGEQKPDSSATCFC